MRIMADSTDVAALPPGLPMYAGYVDGRWPTYDAVVARFPGAVHVSIAVNGSAPADVLDVESGDATPADAPPWCHVMRRAGMVPTVYCSDASWQAVRDAFVAAGEPEPLWWIAAYPGIGVRLYPGTVAHQYTDTGGYDLSIVTDYWPGVDPLPPQLKGLIDMGVCVAPTGRIVVDGVTTDQHKHVLLGPDPTPGSGGPHVVTQGHWTDLDLSDQLGQEEHPGSPVLFTS